MGLFSWIIGDKRSVRYEPTNPQPSVNSLFGIGETVNSIAVTEKSSLQLSAVWACVQVLSNSIASVPVNFYTRDKEGNSFIAKNDAQFRLKRPNTYMTGFIWRKTMMFCVCIRGNAYSQIVRDGNANPAELIPIHPDRVEVMVIEGEIWYSIDNGKIMIPAEDMIHVKGMTSDGIVGMSPISYQAQVISLGLATQNEQKNYYEKGATLDSVLTHPDKLDPDTIKKTIVAWKAQKTGNQKDRIAIIDGGFKFDSVKLTAADAQYLESKNSSVQEIARFFGVPLHLIQSMEASTNNNIEHQGIDYVTHGVLPYAKNFEEELELKLLKFYEVDNTYCKFNLNGLMRGDAAARAAYYDIMIKNNIMARNEVRVLEELNKIDGLDEMLAPLNMIPEKELSDYHMADKLPPSNKRDLGKMKGKEVRDFLNQAENLNGHTLEEILQP